MDSWLLPCQFLILPLLKVNRKSSQLDGALRSQLRLKKQRWRYSRYRLLKRNRRRRSLNPQLENPFVRHLPLQLLNQASLQRPKSNLNKPACREIIPDSNRLKQQLMRKLKTIKTKNRVKTSKTRMTTKVRGREKEKEKKKEREKERKRKRMRSSLRSNQSSQLKNQEPRS